MSRKKGQGPGESKSSPRRIDSAERQGQVLSLRKAGASFDQIARELKYNSPQAAWMALSAALKRTVQEPADDYRKVVRERLFTALRAIWPKVLRGEKEGVDSFVKLHQEICKLDGLNKQIDINVQADQMNVQNNVQTNVTLKFDPKTLTEEQLGKCEQLLTQWTAILTSVSEGGGRVESQPPPGAGPSGNGHAS